MVKMKPAGIHLTWTCILVLDLSVATTFDARHAHRVWPASQCDAPRHGTSGAPQSPYNRAVAAAPRGSRCAQPSVGRGGSRSGWARRATDRLLKEGSAAGPLATAPSRPASRSPGVPLPRRPAAPPPRAARGAPRCCVARGDVGRPAAQRPAPRASRSPGVPLPGRPSPRVSLSPGVPLPGICLDISVELNRIEPVNIGLAREP
jgi:hypothetical protein